MGAAVAEGGESYAGVGEAELAFRWDPGQDLELELPVQKGIVKASLPASP